MKNLINVLVLLVIVSLAFVGCSDKNPTAPSIDSDAIATVSGGQNNNNQTAFTCDADGELVGYEGECPSVGVYEYTLWAGKHYDAGIVRIWTDEANLFVKYDTNETADLQEAHVYVWTNEADIPVKRPAPGQAPYTAGNINADSYTFTIPFSDFAVDNPCGETFYISTHAALIGDSESGSQANAGQTAYSGESTCFDRMKGGAWWGYVTFTVECYYEVSGTVYEDSNNSGDNEGEAGFAGLSVTATGNDGSVVTTTTDAGGYYSFTLLANGNYTITTEAPAGDYAANENAGGFSTGTLTECIDNADFGFVPLYDIFVDVNLLGDLDCYESLVVTINGAEVALVNGSFSLENQLPGGHYVIAFTVYDADGNVLASASQTISSLSEDTTLTFDLNWVCPETPCVDCGDDDGFNETAYLFGNWSFCDVQPRWGWANFILPGQTITETIYAGAGQCNISNGTAVGTATLAYGLNGTLTISIDYFSGYTMNNIHINIDSNDPTTISPNMNSNGNFNNNPTGVSYPTDTFTGTYTVSGPVYVIVHMEAIND